MTLIIVKGRLPLIKILVGPSAPPIIVIESELFVLNYYSSLVFIKYPFLSRILIDSSKFSFLVKT